MDVLEQIVIPKKWEIREEIELDVLKYPLTLNEFLRFNEVCDYRVEYIEGLVFSFIDEESYIRKLLSAKLIYLFSQNYYEDENITVLARDICVYVEKAEAILKADMTVLNGEPTFLKIDDKECDYAITNPESIVEVLSDSTRDFDFGAKLNCYKTIPTLKQIIFIDQSRVHISSYIRTADPNEWINHDYFSIEESLKLIDFEIKIEDIYRKIPVLKKE
jgi:Uma2 family endonuclease